MDNIEISVKGITTTLTFDNRTAELFQHQIKAILKSDPDNLLAYAAAFGLAALVFCGYSIHCQYNDMPLIFSFDDFAEWAVKQAETTKGVELITKINNLYLKLAEA